MGTAVPRSWWLTGLRFDVDPRSLDFGENKAESGGWGMGRDPFVDVLRVGAICTVAVGHWIMPVLTPHGDTVSAGNSLATPGWWVLTWLAQVMPVFFFAGGAANFHSYRRSEDTARWLVMRTRRLAVPVLPLLAVWILLPIALTTLGVPVQPVQLAAGIVGQLLWFLAVYLITMALTPVMLTARARWGWAVPVVLAVAAAGVDVLRFDGVPFVGYLNEVLVWLAVQQLGMEYAAGRLTTRAGLPLAVAGFGGTALLVAFAGYPASMVGLPGQAVSNMSPATICLLTLGCGQIGVLLAVRERLVGWVRRPAIARAVGAVAHRCMTIYLWHMSALVLVAGVTVLGLGYATPAPGSLAWLTAFPLWVGASALTLWLLVAGFGRFEVVPHQADTPSIPRLATSVALLVVGLTGIAAQGFAPATGFPHLGPLPWTAVILLGLALTVPRWRPVLTESGARLLGALISTLPR